MKYIKLSIIYHPDNKSLEYCEKKLGIKMKREKIIMAHDCHGGTFVYCPLKSKKIWKRKLFNYLHKSLCDQVAETYDKMLELNELRTRENS